MESIIIELEKDILNNRLDIVSVLRKGHVIASKLGLEEFDTWINKELNGYSGTDNIPNYRVVRGSLVAKNPYRGWIPVIMRNDEISENLCRRTITNSILELADLASLQEGELVMRLSPEVQQLLNNSFDTSTFFECAIIMPKTAVKDIIQKVKNALLEWCIRLESNGIFGNGFVFTPEEKEVAASKMQKKI